MVLLLLGLSTLLVLPAMDRAVEKQAVRRSAVEIAAVIRDLRGKAIYKGIIQGLLVSSSENSYQALPGNKVILPPAVKISEIVGGELVGEDKRRFVFFPNGSILGGGDRDFRSRGVRFIYDPLGTSFRKSFGG